MFTSTKLTLGGLLLCLPLLLVSQNLNQFVQLLPAEDGLIFGINKSTTIRSLVSSHEGLYILTQKDGCYLLSGESMADLKQLAVPTDRRDLFTGLIEQEFSTYLWANNRQLLALNEPTAERIPFIGEHFTKNVSPTAINVDPYGRIFVGTANNGLFIFRKDEFGGYTDVPVRISTVDKQLPSNTINCLYRDEENVLWVGTSAGVTTIRENVITNLSKPKILAKPNWWQRLFGVVKEEKGFESPVQAITSWGNCILLVNTEGMYKANRQSGELTKLYHYQINDRLTNPMQSLSSVMVDIDGNVWLAGDQLLRYNITRDELSKVSENKPFRGRGFLSITEDKNTGSIWIGTERGGLYELYEETRLPMKSNAASTTRF